MFSHSLKNCDADLTTANAHNLSKKSIDVIVQNSEYLISCGYECLVFKDSFSFLQGSLEKLVKLNKYKEIDGVDVLIDNWQKNHL